MSAGAITERVLVSLRQLLTGRTMRPGDHLDPALLAERLASSVTPVREALHRLSGEGLVESRARGGFILPFLDAAGLQDLYAWSGQVLALAIRAWPRRRRVRQCARRNTFGSRRGAIFGRALQRELSADRPPVDERRTRPGHPPAQCQTSSCPPCRMRCACRTRGGMERRHDRSAQRGASNHAAGLRDLPSTAISIGRRHCSGHQPRPLNFREFIPQIYNIIIVFV